MKNNNLKDEITKPIDNTLYVTQFGSYQPQQPATTGFNINTSTEGETIEKRCERIMNNNEPISDVAPEIFTDRSQGVIPECNPRTDRFDYALEATDQITRNRLAARQKRDEERTKANTPEPTNEPNNTTTPPNTKTENK